MIKLQRLIDKYIGSILIFFLSFLKVFDKKKNIKKRFLIIKLWAIGDSVISLVLIKAIKTLYNGAKVDVLIRNQNKDIFDCYPLDNIHNMDKKFTKYIKDSITELKKVVWPTRKEVIKKTGQVLFISLFVSFFLLPRNLDILQSLDGHV